ncbi:MULTISPECIES: ribonuclease H family protein [unclassified Colwellia]|jgi:ribonuclease HI|uniref:ribonuclease H family protein n=1 Tax=unclassified Colwellia TaxID=196834 RepID=UPI0015F50618|nr:MULTISPECIES: ribonuclease H family protein [unclassified Colwellia]MBA6364855.1 viroplasmin family protein [Colwellia sp. BRX8-8]MBA6338886.1 viroplasmin family protein [Colwellia sp. BRX8-7]MBA6353221.1 viroplasmin family protein [Colwellia sp. BRX9-1]MBA6355864.1 viroplasmin family protein [Colwellia sp. BRX8-3]MBA6359533.1 viroplasmin family protein [Colwellia sp. BRX8-6]
MSKKYYVVWKGSKTGVFDNWTTVQSVTSGRADAQFMGFPSQVEAEAAFKSTYTKALTQRSLKTPPRNGAEYPAAAKTASSSLSRATASAKPAGSTVRSDREVTKANIDIYCDGACSPNPGKSGTGVAVYHQGEIHSLWYGAYNANGTNNTAELIGMLQAFKLAKAYIEANPGRTIQVLSDSKYSIDSITKWATGWKNKGWKKANGEAIKNPELVKVCYTLYQEIKKHIAITHVKGHANIEGNELADRMAVLARTSQEMNFVQYQQTINIREILATEAG